MILNHDSHITAYADLNMHIKRKAALQADFWFNTYEADISPMVEWKK
jgi:hypothetical protein